MNQPDNNILNELREISPVLAAIPRVNIYKVPDGYFEEFAALLLLQLPGVNAGIAANAAVPGGYFDTLSSNIMERIRRESVVENESSSLLAGIGNKNVLKVPAGYFNTVVSSVMQRIKSESSPELWAETNEVSPAVAAIGNKNIFTVPVGYFNDLSASIHSQLVKPAKVVSMSRGRKLVRYAAAAVVTGLLAISAFFIFDKKTSEGNPGMQKDAVMASAESIIKTNSFDKELASLGDADIVNFLESRGQDVDAALVASLMEDVKSLPEAEDYLFNENALDEVLKDLTLTN